MIGKTISHYQILEKLGEGGLGVVYKAKDTRLHRFVAIKVLPPEMVTDPERRRRFTQEARAASALNHPNIITIHDVGEADGVHFISMELVAGRTLSALIPRQGIRLSEVLKCAIQMADALARMHAAGIIHRDLKPSNIMVTDQGLVKLLDFGLAKLMESGPNGKNDATCTMGAVTEAGAILGTVAYMSPEQVRGQVIDARSDLFSLGVVLYEMVSGRRAFHGASSVEVMNAILKDEPLELDAALPPSLNRIIRRCMQKMPDDRFQTALDLAFALDSIPETTARKAPEQAPITAVDQPSLAVLPFIFLSPVEGKESLSLGFADALITSLGRLQNFLVLPTSAILRVPGGADPASVSRELQVRHVLQGSIQKLGSRWRVTLQLHDAKAQRTVFTSKYDFSLDDVFEIQDQICLRVADSLSGEFRSGAPRMSDRYSKDPYAYDEYLRGLKGSYSDTPEIMEEALQHLSHAAERDPDFALAHAALARVLVEKHRSSIHAETSASGPSTTLGALSHSTRTCPRATSHGPTFSGARSRSIRAPKQLPNC